MHKAAITSIATCLTVVAAATAAVVPLLNSASALQGNEVPADTGLANTGLANTGPAGPAPVGPASAGGFEMVATYGDFDAATPLDAPTAWRMIIILQAAGTG